MSLSCRIVFFCHLVLLFLLFDVLLSPYINRDTTLSLTSGATELDTVLNATHLISGEYSAIFSELSALRAAAPKTLLKVIFETSRLTPDQITAACVLASAAAFDYVKTSTGFLAAAEATVAAQQAEMAGDLKEGL